MKRPQSHLARSPEPRQRPLDVSITQGLATWLLALPWRTQAPPADLRRARSANRSPGVVATVMLWLSVVAPSASIAQPTEERANYFDDPFLQVSAGIKACPVPEGPMITRTEMLAESHYRAERGTSCFQAGRCRLPNSYLYDNEIVPRVKKAIEADGRFAETSVWAESRRRWVWLKGCVRRPSEAQALERLVRALDDVEAVVNELAVAPEGSATIRDLPIDPQGDRR